LNISKVIEGLREPPRGLSLLGLRMDELDECTCDSCQREQIILETIYGCLRIEQAKIPAGSYFDHPDCRIAVEEYDELTAQAELAL
jgi:hypothetical protein